MANTCLQMLALFIFLWIVFLLTMDLDLYLLLSSERHISLNCLTRSFILMEPATLPRTKVSKFGFLLLMCLMSFDLQTNQKKLERIQQNFFSLTVAHMQMCPVPPLPLIKWASTRTRAHTHTHTLEFSLLAFPREVDFGEYTPLFTSIPTLSKLKILSNSQNKDILNYADPGPWPQ